METLDTKAQAICAEMTKTKGLAGLEGDTPWLDFIKELVKELLPILLKCFVTVSAAKAELDNPRLLTRARLRLHIRRALRDDDTVNVLGGPLFNAVLAVGKTATEQEITDIAAAI